MFYLGYIHSVMPHADRLSNWLELVNEYCMVLLAYVMLYHSGLVLRDLKNPDWDRMMRYLSIGLILMIVVVNFSVLIITTLYKLVLALEKKFCVYHQGSQVRKRMAKRLKSRGKG